jgi:hypothetical protein
MRIRVERVIEEDQMYWPYHRFEGAVRHQLGVLQPRRPGKEGDKVRGSGRGGPRYSRAFPSTHHNFDELMANDNENERRTGKMIDGRLL